MARREGVKNIGFQLTTAEFAALAAYAGSVKMDKTAVIRAALRQLVPDFPPDTWKDDERWKERENKKDVNVDETS
jgi:hypothetical protein